MKDNVINMAWPHNLMGPSHTGKTGQARVIQTPAQNTSLSLPKDVSQKNYSFLMLPGASMLGFGSAIEPLRLANSLARRTLYTWQTLSVDGNPVRFSNGMHLPVDCCLQAGRKPDFALLVAGDNSSTSQEKQATNWLRRMHRFGSITGTISGGTQILALAGLLEKYPFTLHWEHRLAFEERFPFLSPLNQLYCANDQVITCAGGAAASDLMIHMIELEYGKIFALAVSNMCVHFGMRVGHEPPHSALSLTIGSRNPHLIDAVRIMGGNLEDPLHLADVAREVGVSRRQMERLFKAHTNRTPAQYYKDLRLERGRKLLFETDYLISTISAACGFSNSTLFSRRFKEKFGISPVHLRSQPGLNAPDHNFAGRN